MSRSLNRESTPISVIIYLQQHQKPTFLTSKATDNAK